MKSRIPDDCHKKANAQAEMHILVRRIPKQFGYPLDLVNEATRTGIAQAEAVLAPPGLVITSKTHVVHLVV